MLDNPGKIHAALAGGVERLVDLRAWAPSGVAAPAAFAASCDSFRSFSISAAAKPGL